MGGRAFLEGFLSSTLDLLAFMHKLSSTKCAQDYSSILVQDTLIVKYIM